MIEREVYAKLVKLYAEKDILALIGARRVGKTTLMEQLYETEQQSKLFLTFDDQDILNLFETDIKAFANIYVTKHKALFIDEFQYAKNGGKALKYLYDTYGIKIVISGSSAAELTIQSLSYLVGRVFIVEIYPLNFREFIRYKNNSLLPVLENPTKLTLPLIQPLFGEYLAFGGFPQVVLAESTELKTERLRQIVNTYLLKEIRDILQYKDSLLFERLMQAIALLEGSMINKSKLSSLLDVSIHKVTEILDILEKTFIITRIQPYANTKIKELLKTPKMYFTDSGFRNVLLKNFTPVTNRTDKGVIYEQFILLALKTVTEKVQFYNYKNSSEVDFLVENTAIEVKSHLTGPKIEKSMYAVMDKIRIDKIYIFNDNIIAQTNIQNTPVTITHHIAAYNLIDNKL